MGGLPRKDLAEAMAEVARRLDAATDAAAALALVTTLACEVIPGADQAGVTIGHRDGGMQPVAASGSHLDLPLRAGAESLGMLHLSSSSGSFGEDARFVAELFITHAGIALGRIRKEAQLHEALATRKVIGQALGITMERYNIDQEQAFQLLVRVSQQGNVKLRDIAGEIVERADDPAHALAAPVTAVL